MIEPDMLVVHLDHAFDGMASFSDVNLPTLWRDAVYAVFRTESSWRSQRNLPFSFMGCQLFKFLDSILLMHLRVVLVKVKNVIELPQYAAIYTTGWVYVYQRHYEWNVIIFGFLLLQEGSARIATLKEEIKEEITAEENSLIIWCVVRGVIGCYHNQERNGLEYEVCWDRWVCCWCYGWQEESYDIATMKEELKDCMISETYEAGLGRWVCCECCDG
jgi:hypothetical protein